MKKIAARILGLAPHDTPDIPTEELEALFKSRYMEFKLLLAANNKALDLMAEMEFALMEDKPFGMAFIRSRATAMGVAVYQMIQYLCRLAPDKYEALFDRHKDVQDGLNRILSPPKEHSGGPSILFFDRIDMSAAGLVGVKMAALGEAKNLLGLPTPAGFAVTAQGYHRFLEHNQLTGEINRLIQSTEIERTDQVFALSTAIRQRIVKAALPESLEAEIMTAYQRLEDEAGKGVNVSVRSSALGEDEPGASFAGQYQSQLNVRPDFIPQAYKEVVAGKYTPQAMHYRFMRGLRDDDVAMCVGILTMVDAVAGGVAYSAGAIDPEDDRVHVSSSWGLPKSVVDGGTGTDLFIVKRGDPLEIAVRRIEHKEDKFLCFPAEGVCRMVTTGEEADRPSLDNSTVLEVARLSLVLEEHFGTSQDMEWALDGEGRLFVLQSRPLTPAVPEPEPKERPKIEADPLLAGGIRVSPGAASGPVYVVVKDGDALGFPKDAVLVLSHPLPRWAALLGRASAVIAETGGLAGHLATVAREYHVPALFGLPGAVGVLENDRIVTLDADGGAVYPGRVDALLKDDRPALGFLPGSPVHRALEEAVGLTAPLNLLDPDVPSFKPASCRTFHDITRFCHEMSVREMFDFGKSHHFPVRSSKQLHYNVPMQWWLIDLDDGFREEVRGKYVKLDNIASIPMLSLWEGMVAVPWEGPPAVSGKGLASVLFQATANPALANPFKAPYANRNYFMISKTFLNLQSRFGFHFCTVEALTGDRRGDNYAVFSFRGGAADIERRRVRVRFLAELLGEYGFRVRLNEDTAVARVDGLVLEEMQEKLRIVGYLLMHTRQLDMIMGDPAAIAYYRDKIKNDIRSVISLLGAAPG